MTALRNIDTKMEYIKVNLFGTQSSGAQSSSYNGAQSSSYTGLESSDYDVSNVATNEPEDTNEAEPEPEPEDNNQAGGYRKRPKKTRRMRLNWKPTARKRLTRKRSARKRVTSRRR